RVFTAPIATVDVRTNGGPIIVRAGTASSVTVDTTLERGITRPSHTEQLIGDRLVLTAKCPPTVNVFCRVTYAIRVPEGTSVVADSGGGSGTIVGAPRPGDVSSGGGNAAPRAAGDTTSGRARGGGGSP